MRKIKFRAKTIETGEWVYGETIIRAGDYCYINQDFGPCAFPKNEHYHYFQFYIMPCDVKTLG